MSSKNLSKTPRKAATVLLLRERGGHLQVYLLKRSGKSAFFPRSYVFPGGGVDPHDARTDLWSPLIDEAPPGLERRLGTGLETGEVLGFCVAAVRETFEEAGVLLISRGRADEAGLQRLHAQRASGALPRGWLQEAILESGWTLALSGLAPWSRWITPEGMPVRFDTLFFIAFMPSDQTCRPDGIETTEGLWITPTDGLEGNASGDIPLSPPTLTTLHELIPFPRIEELRRETEKRTFDAPRMPRRISTAQGPMILMPWDPRWSEARPEPATGDLEEDLIPVGAPFSRLWQRNGLWRPVRTR